MAHLIVVVAKWVFAKIIVPVVLGQVAQSLFGVQRGLGDNLGREFNTRSSIQTRRLIYGERIVSGAFIYIETTIDSAVVKAISGTAVSRNNEFIHLIIPLATHLVEAIGDIYFNDTRIAVEDIDSNGFVTDTGSVFHTRTRIIKFLGHDSQIANADLIDESESWTAAHRLRGIAYLYVRLQYNQTVFPAGVPNIRAIVKGKKVWDPRDTGKTIIASTFISGGSVNIEATAHGFSTDDHIFIFNHEAGGEIFGEYEITIIDVDNFTIEQDLTSSTGSGIGGTATLMRYSTNPALCKLDYLVSEHGLNIFEREVDTASVIAAANICDEQIDLTQDNTFITVAVSTDILTRTNIDKDFSTGSIVQFTTAGTLPAGLSLVTDYYYIHLTRSTFRVATTLRNALEGVSVNITDTGSGLSKVVMQSQLRYDMNGVVELGQQPIDILAQMNTADMGTIVPIQGKYKIYSGAFPTAIASLNEDDLRGQLDVDNGPSRENLINAVRGTYVNPDDFWQPTEFPNVVNTFYEQQDGEQLYRDVQLPFITNSTRAQRIGKLILERSRQGIGVFFPAKLTALKITPWDTVTLSIDKLGWVNKEFRVVSWQFSTQDSLGIDLVLNEDAPGVYDWNLGEETAFDHAPNTNLPSLESDTIAPTNLVLLSGAGELFVNGDGTVITRIRAVWTLSIDIFAEYYEVQARNITTGEDYITIGIMDASISEIFITPAEDGEDYDVRVRTINVRGVRSDFIEVTGHTVIGKTKPPADVTGFSAVQNGDMVVIQWDQVPDVDLAGYEIRYNPGTNLTWGDATPLNKVIRGTQIIASTIPEGNQTILIKAFDTSENESTNVASAALVVTSIRNIILQNPQPPDWPGLISAQGDSFLLENDSALILETGSSGAEPSDKLMLETAIASFILHDISRRLVPNSLNLASDDDFETFDEFVPNPVLLCIYESPEQDVTFEDTVRVWADIQSALGPGETTGVAAPVLYIDYSEEGSGGDVRTYDGFEIWTIGDVSARYIKQQVRLNTVIGIAYISLFTPTVDLLERTEKADAAVIAASGTLILFAREFHIIPAITCTVQGASGLIATHINSSVTGFTIHVFNTGGTDVGGVVDWQAIGV